jgi:hypothetical protein
MKRQQLLRKQLINTRHKTATLLADILSALQVVDPAASVLPLDQALASRELVLQLWKLLPEETDAYHFDSPEALTENGKAWIEPRANQRVTLHLGWDVLCFSTTVAAAWETWPRFCQRTTDTYNTCLYPEALDWYLIRAGNFLYPMVCNQKYEIEQSMD